MAIAGADIVALNRAASLLDTIGRNADAEDGMTAIYCLHAAELLASAGHQASDPVHRSAQQRGRHNRRSGEAEVRRP
jgi:hypothetical protein